MSRFIRDYELIITLTSGEVVKIVPELKVVFEITKSIRGGLNTCKIQIYNLTQDKQRKLVKDKEDGSIRLPFIFKAGYDKLETLFKGTVFEASSVKSGSDFITTIVSQDGGFDFINSFTSKTVTNNNVSNIIDDMQNTNLGKITTKKELIRPKVLVGNSAKLIEENLEDDETYFIDEEKLYIIKTDEVVSSYIPLIQANTGLLNTPVRKNSEVIFNTLLNPAIKIGGLCELKSQFATHLNAIYKVVTIKYKGDNYGSDWSQECTCTLAQNYKVL
ncbi:hypothetical protein [Sulfurimonas sp.]|uniref:baseplate hub protein n=1 Tax=Sulfurimonas sp. TaxID=2022749 RepID=UPI003562232C